MTDDKDAGLTRRELITGAAATRSTSRRSALNSAKTGWLTNSPAASRLRVEK